MDPLALMRHNEGDIDENEADASRVRPGGHPQDDVDGEGRRISGGDNVETAGGEE